MDKEEEKYFLVTQRDALASASAGVRKSEKFEVHYTKLGAKKTLSRKANTSPSDDGTLVDANQFYQYCVVDDQDRLVKPKKITKKGKHGSKSTASKSNIGRTFGGLAPMECWV